MKQKNIIPIVECNIQTHKYTKSMKICIVMISARFKVVTNYWFAEENEKREKYRGRFK